MNKLKIILLLLWVTVAASAQEVEEPDTFRVDTIDVALPWPQNIQYRLDSLLRHPMFETSIVGLEVYDLTADSILYKVNEHQMLRPASTMKLVTAIAAIDKLGGSFQFRTQLYYTGHVDDHTLSGNLYCVGGFDPRFNIDDMNAFVESIRRMGVDTIRGSIVADRTIKDSNLLGEGWCWDDDNPKLSPLTIGRNTEFTERFIRQLTDDGVVLEVSVVDGALPDSAYHLCSRYHSIDQVLQRMMKQSDNFYAEALFYQLAANQGFRPARAKDAAAIVKRLITQVGLGNRPYRIADGSGLSLYNYLSAELEVRLLRYAYHNSTIYLHLLPSLPVAGVDGTLRDRMRGTFAADNVKAKTGTVEGVSSLAGYCTAANGHQLCFSIINQGVMHTKNGRRFQDRVCNALCAP